MEGMLCGELDFPKWTNWIVFSKKKTIVGGSNCAEYAGIFKGKNYKLAKIDFIMYTF